MLIPRPRSWRFWFQRAGWAWESIFLPQVILSAETMSRQPEWVAGWPSGPEFPTSRALGSFSNCPEFSALLLTGIGEDAGDQDEETMSLISMQGLSCHIAFNWSWRAGASLRDFPLSQPFRNWLSPSLPRGTRTAQGHRGICLLVLEANHDTALN